MIVFIRVSGDEVAIAIPVILIRFELMCGVRGTAAVDDDLAALQPLHAVIDGPGALDGRLRGESQGAVVCDALRLAAVAGDLRIGVAV